MNAHGCLHWAIGRGRSVPILQMLLDAGANVNLPHPRVGHRPLAVAARCGHVAAYELLAGRGATAELDSVEAAVLAMARGESVQLPAASPPMPGIPGDGSGWLLSQFASLGRTEVVRALVDAGLVERGADLLDCAFDEDGPTPLDCALWGLQHSHAHDGDYRGTVHSLLAAGAPTQHAPPTGDEAIDALLTAHGIG
jgi:ankyrin repeat protein